MEILGNLGIDIKLLIAQIINFSLLLWLLTKFLYKPIVKRIEKDELVLKQSQIQTQKMERQTSAFAEQKKEEIMATKKRAQEIIEEAEGVSIEIKNEMHKKAKMEAEAMIAQSKNRIKSLKPEIEQEISQKMRREIGVSFKESFTGFLPASSQEIFQQAFWLDFVKQIKEKILKELCKSNLVEISEKTRIPDKSSSKKLNATHEKIEGIFVQKVSPAVLEYAYTITAKQVKELETMVLEKSGIKLDIDKKQNDNLVSGFRFEIAGMLIESNLLNIINDAASFKK